MTIAVYLKPLNYGYVNGWTIQKEIHKSICLRMIQGQLTTFWYTAVVSFHKGVKSNNNPFSLILLSVLSGLHAVCRFFRPVRLFRVPFVRLSTLVTHKTRAMSRMAIPENHRTTLPIRNTLTIHHHGYQHSAIPYKYMCTTNSWIKLNTAHCMLLIKKLIFNIR